MNKKFAVALTAILSCGVALSFAGCNTQEATLQYTLSQDGTYYIVSGVSGAKRTLVSVTIPQQYGEEGNMLPVKEIGDEAFRNCTALTFVSLPEGLERIGVMSFMKCNFESFEIPATVVSIGASAFGMCSTLKQITIPQSVTSIGIKAFKYCSGLETVYFKAQVSTLPADVFANSVVLSAGSNLLTDSKLTTVYLTDYVTRIDVSSLYGNTITDVYYAGSSEQWDAVELFEQTTQTDESDETKQTVVETVLNKSDYFSTITLHFNTQF
jgi:hypothetical protein